MISQRLNRISTSASATQFERIKKLQNAGGDVAELNVGEPHFGTPEFVIEAAIRAMREQKTGYTPVSGLPALREAIANKLQVENNLSYRTDQVQVTSGSKQAIFNVLLATLEEGDEVIVPTPCWVSYTEMVSLLGGTPRRLKTFSKSSFVPQPADLEALITPKTKWLILNSPCNPTGAVYDAVAVEALGAVLQRHPYVGLLSDDIYEHLVFDDSKFKTILELLPALKDRAVVINGFSKAYCMTGWRLGYAAGPSELINAMHVIQSHSTTHASAVSQWAGLAALRGDQEFLKKNVDELKLNRDTLVDAIVKIKGMSCVTPHGAFYAFPSCSGLIGAKTVHGAVLHNDVDVADFLLQEAGVACMSGSNFSMSDHLRISFTVPHEILVSACERMLTACSSLRLQANLSSLNS